jgi:hypothetical protein
MRAGHVSCQYGRSGPPASLSSRVSCIMHTRLRKFMWLTPIVGCVGIAAAFAIFGHSTVVFMVTSVQRESDGPVARCQIQNRGDRPIELRIHTFSHTPCYHHLERSGGSWRRVLWDACCGMDLESKMLAPGQNLSFTAPIIDTNRPTRLALSYRRDGADYTATTKTIAP